jgi:hypothetical protein
MIPNMPVGLQLAMLGGGLIGLGVAMLVIRFLPAEPDLADALDRLSATRHPTAAVDTGGASRQERLGLWAIRVLPPGVWARTPTKELALLRIPLARFYGEKILFAFLGAAIPPALVLLGTLVGFDLPLAIPAVASAGLAAGMFFLPNYNAIDEAKKARVEFSRALGAYIELVALERVNGTGVRQAMEAAAKVGDTWVFARILEELTLSGWSGRPPWDALHAVADELGLPELDDFADIMRLSGTEGAAVYGNLRARAAAMRTAMLNEQLAAANAVGERMSIPGSLLGVIFMALLLAPSLLRMVTGT